MKKKIYDAAHVLCRSEFQVIVVYDMQDSFKG